MMVKKYVIQLSSAMKNAFEIFNTDSYEVVSTHLTMQDATNSLIKLEKIDYCKEYDGFSYVHKYTRKRYNLKCYEDFYYMDIMEFLPNGYADGVSQKYNFSKLPTDNSYTLVCETNNKKLIVETLKEKKEFLARWKNLTSMKNECVQLIKEIGMLEQRLDELK